MLTDEVVDYLGQVRVSEFFSQYNYITIYPGWPDDLRFNVTENSGAVQNSELQTTGTGQNPIVRTQDSANYAPGSPAIFGSGTSIPDVPTGDQYMEWGADDGTDAAGFGRDATGAYIYYMDEGSKTKIYENDQGNGGWNGQEVRGFNQIFAVGGDLKLQLLLNPSLTVNTARDLPGGTSPSETR